jgi:carboxypeptidase C (cathepsin A)
MVNGTGLTANPNAWNTIANMVFVEQPAGVGFSVNTATGFKYGDAQAALDNYRFVVGFMKAYPQFKNTPFYTTSESYGGHYMPTLAEQIVKNGGVPNYKGFMVGNPLTYMPDRNYGMYGTFYGHQLLPKPLWDSFVNNSCQAIDAPKACDAILDEADSLTQGMDPYALDFPVCNDAVARRGRNERNQLMRKIRMAEGKLDRDLLKGYFPAQYQPCNSDYATMYLNRADVQKAIHVEGTVHWSDCSNAVGQAYSNDDVNAPMMPVYKYLIDQKKQPLKLMIFSGDDDSICATMGTQQFIWDLGYAVKEKWAPWTMDGQVSGFTTQFDGLRFSTVHGAGHMVPNTRPTQALEVLRKYLSGEW